MSAGRIEPGRRRVIFIAGAGRSGSTLLNALLGQSPDVVALGEVRFLWERGIVARRRCSCGQPVTTCEQWSPVVARVAPDRDTAVAMTRDLDIVLRIRSLVKRRSARVAQACRRAASGVDALYSALEEETGSRCFVDSSKRPMWGALLAQAGGTDLRVVHLVRDPRATAWSWQRRKLVDDGGPRVMQRIAPWRAVALWIVWNLATERMLGHRLAYRVVSYDRLVGEPSVVVEEILDWAGAAVPACFPEPGVATLGPVHAIAGNADRFATGRTAITEDEEWRRRMPCSQRVLVGAATYPWRRRYLARP